MKPNSTLIRLALWLCLSSCADHVNIEVRTNDPKDEKQIFKVAVDFNRQIMNNELDSAVRLIDTTVVSPDAFKKSISTFTNGYGNINAFECDRFSSKVEVKNEGTPFITADVFSIVETDKETFREELGLKTQNGILKVVSVAFIPTVATPR